MAAAHIGAFPRRLRLGFSRVFVLAILYGCHKSEASAPQEDGVAPSPTHSSSASGLPSGAPVSTATHGVGLMPTRTPDMDGTARTIGGPPSGPASPRAVREEAVIATGSIQVDIVKRFVRRSYGDIRACRDASPGTIPKPFGRIEVRFTIASDGTVATMQVSKETLGSATLVSCVTAALRAVPFPQATDGSSTSVSYTLILEPATP